MNQTRASLGLTLLLLSSTACGADDGGAQLEDIEATSEAFGESSCLTAATNRTIVFGPSATETTYSNQNCSKTFIFERSGLAPDPTGAWIHWTDPWVRNEVQCRNGKLRVQVQSRAGTSGAFRNEGSFSLPLVWDAATATCMYPSAVIEENTQSFLPLGYIVEYKPGGVMPHTQPHNFDLGNRVVLPGSILGRHVRYAVQALTPLGNTQSVEIH
jgi:hypothetical protein